jgi:hypothetical protein
VLKEVSLPQEGDTSEIIGETTTNVGKPIVTSNVVGKIIEVDIEEQNSRDANTKQILEVKMLEEEAIKDMNVEKRLLTLEDDVVVIINQMGEMGHQQEKLYH